MSRAFDKKNGLVDLAEVGLPSEGIPLGAILFYVSALPGYAMLAHIADHPVNRVGEFLPGIAPSSWHLPQNTPLRSDVTILEEFDDVFNRNWARAYSRASAETSLFVGGIICRKIDSLRSAE